MDCIPLHIFYGKKDNLTNNTYYPNENDKVFFALMEPNQRFEDAILKKAFVLKDLDDNTYNRSTGVLRVPMYSQDTELLEPGDYYYQVKLLKKDAFDDDQLDENSRPETIIQKTKFTIVD